MFVKTEIILNDQEDDQRCTNANGQSGNIDEGEKFMFPDIAKSNGYIVSKHNPGLTAKKSLLRKCYGG